MKSKASTTNTNKDVSVLEKYIQVIPSELLTALKESAVAKGIALDMEVALRLTALMAEPELVADNALSQQILGRKFVEQEAVAECKRKRMANFYLYEMQKLKLFLQFEKNLPRQMKENFILIDVEAETKRIKAELAAEAKAQREKDQSKD